MDTQGTPNADDQGNPEFQIERGAPALEPDIADQPTIILGTGSAPARASAQPAPPPPEPVATPTGRAEAAAIEPESPIPEAVPSAGAAPVLATPIAPAPAPTAAHPVASVSPASGQPQPRVVPVATPAPLRATGALAALGTAPRSPQRAEYREPSLRARFAPYATALVFLGAAGAGTTYLILSRRRRVRAARPLDLRVARARLAQAWVATSVARQTALSRLPSLDRSRAVARWRRKRPGFTAGAYLRTMRDTVSRRLSNMASAVGVAAALAAMSGARAAARQRIHALGDLMGGIGNTAQVGVDRAKVYGMRIGAASRAVLASPWRIGGAAQLAFTRRMGRARVVASARVEARRRATRRRVARLGRRLRWFRRGVYAGAIWGILFAPASGRATREKLSTTFRGLTRREGATPRAPARALHAGSAGPHPLSPAETARAPFTGVESAAPFLQPTSEEPLAPPPPDMVEGEFPGTPSVS